MTAKEYLQQIRNIDILIRNKQDEIKELEAKVGVKAISYESDGSKPASRNILRTEELMIKLVMLKDEMNHDVDTLIDKKREVMSVIDSLDNPDEVNLLYLRYLRYMKWEQIALEMNYSYKHVHNIHGKALKSIDERLHKITQKDML